MCGNHDKVKEIVSKNKIVSLGLTRRLNGQQENPYFKGIDFKHLAHWSNISHISPLVKKNKGLKEQLAPKQNDYGNTGTAPQPELSMDTIMSL